MYGANGFVGREIAAELVARGLSPILAGRNQAAVEALGLKLNLPTAIFGVAETNAARSALTGCAILLNCAGPFSRTAGPLAAICLDSGTNYLDITGEISVFETLQAMGAQAKAKSIMLLPGVGFDVAATDCLALYLSKKLPNPQSLTLGFWAENPAGLPPGTQHTAIESLPKRVAYRKDGQLRRGRHAQSRWMMIGGQRRKLTQLSWGDVFTAWYSTGIPNIEVYTEFPKHLRSKLWLIEQLRGLFRWRLVRAFLHRRVRTGPDAKLRDRAKMHVAGEVSDGDGSIARASLVGPDAGVTWTAWLAVEACKQVLEGRAIPGYRTPAVVFGEDFVLGMEGVTRHDELAQD